MRPLSPQFFTNEQHDILTGLMLGDGHLNKLAGARSNSCLEIKRSVIDQQYLLWSAEKFSDFATPSGVKVSIIHSKQTDRDYSVIRFRTRQLPVFTTYRHEWYPQSVKCVPRTLKLTPLTVAIWFSDDGRMRDRKNFSLATEGFTKSDVVFLLETLSDFLSSPLTLCKHAGSHCIYGGVNATNNLLDLIEHYIPPGMDRKTKLYTNALTPRLGTP